jgi:hypothetical protein
MPRGARRGQSQRAAAARGVAAGRRNRGTHLVLNHQREAQRVCARVLQGHTHHARRVANHEGHRLRRHRVRRADEVALVLSVLVVHDHHELPRSHRRQRLRNRGKPRRGLVRVQRLRRLRVPGSHGGRHSERLCTPAARATRPAAQRRRRRRAAAQRTHGRQLSAAGGGAQQRAAQRLRTRRACAALRGGRAARHARQRLHGAQPAARTSALIVAHAVRRTAKVRGRRQS